MRHQHETQTDDNTRTTRLMDALDNLGEAGDPEAPLTPFEDVLLAGLGCGPHCTGSPYPPPGHTYPTR